MWQKGTFSDWMATWFILLGAANSIYFYSSSAHFSKSEFKIEIDTISKDFEFGKNLFFKFKPESNLIFYRKSTLTIDIKNF